MNSLATIHEVAMPKALDLEQQRWQAVLAPHRSRPGEFFVAVSSTRIFCRPSCPARHAARERVRFFETAAQAEQAGYRACLRCRPLAAPDLDRGSVRAICAYIQAHLDEPLTLARLAKR